MESFNWINQQDAATFNKLEKLQHLLVDSVESMMMHGLANPKFINTKQARDIYAYIINLGNCCILLVDSVESVMMHGLANPKDVMEVFSSVCSSSYSRCDFIIGL
jgi:hypothetical protein